MKPTTIETLISDQLFKITKQDEQFTNYIIDCACGLNSSIESKR